MNSDILELKRERIVDRRGVCTHRIEHTSGDGLFDGISQLAHTGGVQHRHQGLLKHRTTQLVNAWYIVTLILSTLMHMEF